MTVAVSMVAIIKSMKLWYLLVVLSVITFLTGETILHAQKGKDKDKTPPVITEVRTESVTETSALVLWTTDEPADSSIRYGIAPRTNERGPEDPTLVTAHAIALSGLIPQTTYAFCVESRDAAHNRAEECGTFVTSSETIPTEGGGGLVPTTPRVLVTGYAYPEAKVSVSITPFIGGKTIERHDFAQHGGYFEIEITDPKFGFSSYSISAKDKEGSKSTSKVVYLEYLNKSADLFNEAVVFPPTLNLERDVVGTSDEINLSGSAQRNVSVLVDIGDTTFETKSNPSGKYTLTVSSATFPSGKYRVRARTALISESGYDYSLSKTVTISDTPVPEADLNADGVVNIIDFSSFLTKPRDLNNDGSVNIQDISLFMRAFKI